MPNHGGFGTTPPSLRSGTPKSLDGCAKVLTVSRCRAHASRGLAFAAAHDSGGAIISLTIMTTPAGMFVRTPAVAGRFYPANPATLSAMISIFLDEGSIRRPAIGVVVPHAGFIYSGHVAGAVYSRISIPSRTIILCPNHTGYGVPLSIMRRGEWQTPLGSLEIDS